MKLAGPGTSASVSLAMVLATACQAQVERPVSPTPVREQSPPPVPSILVVAAGDIVCEPTSSNFDGHDPAECKHRATARSVDGAQAVLALGDLQYPDGSLEAYRAGYDRTWGRFAGITYPAPGNHEYESERAQGYFDYWASKGRPTGAGARGYYSFDLGSWHLISLDSSCTDVPCEEGSPQNDFLERDLANTEQPCILAYWHHPYFNSGRVHGEEMLPGVRAFWDDLAAAGADLVLNGHEHNYQRYAKQEPSGRAAKGGIREFVVGTGGKSHYGLLDEKDPNYQTGNATDFGVLRLYLADRSYSWEFVAVGGAVVDRGGPTRCN